MTTASHVLGLPCESNADSSSPPEFRLVNGSSSCEGRVELQVQGSWAPLCATHWDIADATVLCHQLNCGNAVAAPRGGHFGDGDAAIWPDAFHCGGTEPYLWNCPVSTLGAPACAPGNSASAVCSGESVALRLRGGTCCCAGWLDVFYNGTWGAVCSNALKDLSLSIICKQLGCGEWGWLENRPFPSAGTGTAWVDNIECRPLHNSTLWQCPSHPWHPHSCDLREQVWITCAGGQSLALVRGGNRCEGLLQVQSLGQQGLVCGDHWGLREASVICRQLGCGRALYVPTYVVWPQEAQQSLLQGVQCQGVEASLWDCSLGKWGSLNGCECECIGAVHCSGRMGAPGATSASLWPCPRPRPSLWGGGVLPESPRLVNGSSSCEGRVELQVQGSWAPLCATHWDIADATVLCHQLNCGSAVATPRGGHFGDGDAAIWPDAFHCGGTEPYLWNCPVERWGRGDCAHKEDAGVRCL
ncbi:hypothetical protein EGK_21589, partial [Macaca mulatta]